MHAWEQIQKTVDYIEDHLSEEITVGALADMAALSTFYYQRLFRRLVKKPVMEYIKLRRMAKATDGLLQGNQRILDVALDLGFSSHQQFSRTFKATFGVTPEDYRKKPTMFNRMTKPQLLLNYTLIDEDIPLIMDGIVLEIGRKRLDESQYFIGKEARTPVALIEELGVESGEDPLETLWQDFHREKVGILGLIPEGEEMGMSYLCSEDGYFCYFAGGRADTKEAPKDYQNQELSPGEYIVCSFEAESLEQLVMDALFKARRYLFEVWLPHHKLTTEPFCAERYEAGGEGAVRMELWVRPAKS